ncbi:hypothetical protein Daus18300_007881 [Diaporthe australafricana]|uniref:Cytochrome P450 n=1 Tax=Diaporthe australafricana TaxID=127596 RepID=A0ABR3WKR5_9PEZI
MASFFSAGLTLFELVAAYSCGVLSWDNTSRKTACLFLGLFILQWLGYKLYSVFIYPFYVSPLRRIPGPTGGHLFFGQFINLFRAETPISTYNEWKRQFPDEPIIRYLTLGNNEVIIPLTAEAQKYVLQTRCYDFPKPLWWQKMVRGFLGLGIATLEGDDHKLSRKLLSSSFALSNIRKLQPAFQKKAQQMCVFLDEAIASSDDGTGVVDVGDLLRKATLDVMGTTTLGTELSDLQDTHEGGNKARYNFCEAYDMILSEKTMSVLLMFANPYVPGGLRWLPLQANRDFLFASSWVRKTLTNLVRERYRKISNLKMNGKYRKDESSDLLTFIVEESGPGGVAEGIPEEHLVGHLLQFMAAGHETSATTIAYALLAMAENHAIQDTVRAEIEKLYLRSENPTSTEIDGLPYLENFVKECLPTTTHRESRVDMVFENTAIPAGTTFDIIPAMTLLDKGVWGSDVNEFDPTRWDRLSEEQLFAMLEMKVFLVELVRHHCFLKLEGSYSVPVPGLTMRPTNMRIRLEKIASK